MGDGSHDDLVSHDDLKSLEVRLIERMEKSELYLLERIGKSETTLLKEFRKWAVPVQAKQRVFEASVTGFSERLEAIEDRLRDLEER